MLSPLESLIQCGTKLWLDSIDPDLVRANRQLGATGATSNPVIVANLIKTGRFDDALLDGLQRDWDDDDDCLAGDRRVGPRCAAGVSRCLAADGRQRRLREL